MPFGSFDVMQSLQQVAAAGQCFLQQAPQHSAWPSSCRNRVRVQASSGTGATAAATADYRSKPANQINVLVVGPTGYIGK
jgi:hypothetical protein